MGKSLNRWDHVAGHRISRDEPEPEIREVWDWPENCHNNVKTVRPHGKLSDLVPRKSHLIRQRLDIRGWDILRMKNAQSLKSGDNSKNVGVAIKRIGIFQVKLLQTVHAVPDTVHAIDEIM